MRMDWIAGELEGLKKKGLFRSLCTIESAQEPRIILDGKELIHLSSNNYLGLTIRPKVKKAAIEALEHYGTGSGGSRLTCGNHELYNKLERRIAEFKETEDAVFFSTGYMENIGTISALMEKNDLILSDELNHASIIDGCRLSRADVVIYPHRDTSFIEKTLRNSKHKKKLVVTDGIFSMDGDVAPLPEIVELAGKYDAMVMVDDAHATGVLGKHRRGTADYFNMDVDINMGTLSKALASIGGYVAGSSELVDYLRNKARAFVYSTALPPAAVAAAVASIDIIENEDPAEKLWQNVAEYRKGLAEIGINTTSETQIIPLMTGSTEKTMKTASELQGLGVFAQGIRPPTVPEGRGRIRTSLMASHSEQDINDAVLAISMLRERFA